MFYRIALTAAVFGAAAAIAAPAHAMTVKECRAAFESERSAMTLYDWHRYGLWTCDLPDVAAGRAKDVAEAKADATEFMRGESPRMEKTRAILMRMIASERKEKEASAAAPKLQELAAATPEKKDAVVASKEAADVAPKKREPAAVAPEGVVFPTAVDGKFAGERPGLARMHTCLEQYRINRKNNALGGLTWMRKGGGYYSLCNARLKG